MSFSEKLFELRTLNGISQKELADALGVAQSSINYWEKGQRDPSSTVVKKIADYFNVSLDYLMEMDINKIKQAIEKANDEALAKEQGYYQNEETAKVAQQIFERKEMRALFDAAKDADPEDLETAYNMLLALKRKERKTE